MDLDEDIARLLPHRPPMVLLDRIGVTDADTACADWTVPSSGPWTASGRLKRGVFIEIAAQTAAAGAGRERIRLGLPPLAGFLGGLREVRFHDDAASGDRLTAFTRIGLRFEQLVRVDFTVHRGTDMLCEGEMTLAMAEGDPSAPGAAPRPGGDT